MPAKLKTRTEMSYTSCNCNFHARCELNQASVWLSVAATRTHSLHRPQSFVSEHEAFAQLLVTQKRLRLQTTVTPRIIWHDKAERRRPSS